MNTQLKPSPWQLNGKGYIILYHFSRKSLSTIQPTIHDNLIAQPGIGGMMIVDYQHSDIGSYQELLLIPGLVRHQNQKYRTITNIYVSTEVSIINGIRNWGIPKQLAHFRMINESKYSSFSVSTNDHCFFKASLKPYGPSFPISTRLVPLQLVQSRHGRLLETTPTGKGVARLARLDSIWIDAHYFPNISHIKPLLALEISNFAIRFPDANILSDD